MTSPSTSPLNQRLSEYVAYAHETRAEFMNYIRTLPPFVLSRRATPDGWSVAEILEHLTLVEGNIGRLVNSFTKQLREQNAPPETDSSSILGSLDHLPADNGEVQKIIAPERVLPTGTMSAPEALEKMVEIRERLLQAVEAANGVDLSLASYPHLAFGPLNGYQWLMLICKHELRHMKQIKQIVHDLEGLPQ